MTRPYYTHAAQGFADVVRQHADRKALVWSASEATSYAELDALSNRIARLLLSRGVRKRDTICIRLEKELVTYACIIACVKLGVPYFVVDPANPRPRTQTMIERCRPALAFVDTSVGPDAIDVPAIGGDAAAMATLLEGVSDRPVSAEWPIDGSDPAYIM